MAKIWTAYAPESDMTFIMRESNGEIAVSGFYFGEPNETATELYKDKLTAEMWCEDIPSEEF